MLVATFGSTLANLRGWIEHQGAYVIRDFGGRRWLGLRPTPPAPPSMLILFDHVTPKGIARALVGHTVAKAKDRGWDTLSNGDLLAAAEAAGFDVFVTADKNMRYQQNLVGHRIGLVVLGTPQWPVAAVNKGFCVSSASSTDRPP